MWGRSVEKGKNWQEIVLGVNIAFLIVFAFHPYSTSEHTENAVIWGSGAPNTTFNASFLTKCKDIFEIVSMLKNRRIITMGDRVNEIFSVWRSDDEGRK